MKKVVIIIIYLSVLLLGISCRNKAKRIDPILQHAESLLEQNPDSALLVLDEINDAQKLKKALYYEYYLLQIQAKYKSYKDITTDTLVFTIRDYYENKNSIEKSALATYYSGRVYQEQKKYDKALQQFLNANQYLKQSNNLNLKGLCQSAIGNIYYKQFLKDKAIKHFKAAKDYYQQASDFKNEIISTKFIGNCLLVMGKTDSALSYFNEAIDMADVNKIKSQQTGVRIGLGAAYRELEDWKHSIHYFNEAMEFCTDSLSRVKLATNIARVYQLGGKNDSAIYHLQQALAFLPSSQNNSLVASIYDTWSGIEENRGNYYKALDKYKQYNNHLAEILLENKNKAVLEIEAKYNFQLIENKNKQLLIERLRLVLLSLGLLLCCVILILWFLRRAATREKELRETEQKLRQMQGMVDRYNEKENTFRNILIRHLDILKKTALLEKYLKEDERVKGERLLLKFNEVVYGQKELDWSLLFETLNNASNGFFKQLKNRFPQLDDSEFRICCLAYTDFNNTEITLILNYRVSSIEVKKSTIRKKLGIESRGNVRNFLMKEVK